jgi:hypothetical protein
MKNGLSMKKYQLVLLLVILGTGAWAQKKKALFVIVDGIAADVIENQPTPFLKTIAKAGGYTRAHVGGEKGGYSQTPTISAVGYNSLLTGTWVNKHNVWGNDIKAPNYHYWTLFRFLKEQYPQKKTAVFSSWLDNRTKLVGENLPATGPLTLTHNFDGLELDTVQFPHDKQRDFMHRIDEAVVNDAVDYIKKEAPDLSWVYLEYTDDMGHAHGDSPEFYRAVDLMDKQMGRLWEAIQYRQKQFKEEWVIYITTDHGRDAKTGKGHGGQSDRERSTWMVTNAKELNDHFKTGNPGIVDIMPSIARFLGLQIPRTQLMEIDGVPLQGTISATDAQATVENGKLNITWKAVTANGDARIWVATTNLFKEGKEDSYKLMATVKVANEKAVIDVSALPADFYKIVIEAKHNSLNRWVMMPKAQ